MTTMMAFQEKTDNTNENCKKINVERQPRYELDEVILIILYQYH